MGKMAFITFSAAGTGPHTPKARRAPTQRSSRTSPRQDLPGAGPGCTNLKVVSHDPKAGGTNPGVASREPKLALAGSGSSRTNRVVVSPRSKPG